MIVITENIRIFKDKSVKYRFIYGIGLGIRYTDLNEYIFINDL